MNDVCYAFRHYADFSGVMPRRAFWNFIGATHSLLVLLMLPLLAAFMDWAQGFMENPLVLDAIVSLMGNPAGAGDIFYGELMPEAKAEAASFIQACPETHPVAVAALVLVGLWGLALVVPTASATVRRLRDAGQSPFWVAPVFLSCVPEAFCCSIGLLFSLVLFILCLQPSKVRLPQAGVQGQKPA